MRLLFLGDTHGLLDLDGARALLPTLRLGARDAVVQLGDIGVAWQGAEDEALAFWRSLPCRVLVCLGNHENYRWLASRPLKVRWGAKGRDLGGSVFAPLAGETVRMGGKSLWFYPGGFSVDFAFRTPGATIYADELLPVPEAERALGRALRRRHIDFVLSHDGPSAFIRSQLGYPIKPPPPGYWRLLGEQENSRAHPALLLDRLYARPELFTAWYFGHHHRDVAEGALRCLWKKAALYDTQTGETRILPMPSA